MAQVPTLEEGFMNAVVQGDIDSIESSIENGVDIDFKDRDSGVTSLMVAIFLGRTEVVRLLLEKEIKVNSRDNNGWTSLMWAGSVGNKDFVEFLLDFNTDIDKTDIDLADNDNITPLMFSITSGYGDITRLLVEREAGVNFRDRYSNTALILAAVNGNESTVRLLVDKGADINAKDKRGMTALVRAFLEDHFGIVRLLLQLGADPPPDFNLVPFIGRPAALIAN